jgi:acetoin utilization deacetylase AcuC-like enzyme
MADRADLGLVHAPGYLAALDAAAPDQGYRPLDPDTWLSAGSQPAARRAAGAVAAAVRRVAAGEAERAFCAVRPPGHHAEPARAMGFCLFNNVAVGALRARQVHNLARVAVIDFDVHHGNGTQAAFWDDASLFYGSTHQSPLYPGTGAAGESGTANNIVNVPLPPMSGSAHFRNGMLRVLLPALDQFGPEMVLISAGFDAHRADPLAQLLLDEADYAWATQQLLDIARKHAGGRVVSTLEGGYDLGALGASAAAHVRALMSA